MLAFAGTTITTRAAVIPPRAAGAVLVHDRIKNGVVPTFPQHTGWYQLTWLMLPLLIVFYISVLVATTRASARQNSTVSAYFPQIVHPVSDHDTRLQGSHGVSLKVLRTCILPACALGVCGLLLMALNLFSPKVQEADGCSFDPFIQTTSASIKQRPSIAYQYCWCVGSCTVTAIMLYFVYELDGSGHTEQAKRLYSHMLTLVVARSQRKSAIASWRHKAGVGHNELKSTVPRKALRMVLILPLAMVSSLPAVAFVMSENMPKPDSFVLSFLANSSVIAVIKMLFAALVVPTFAHFLVRIKYGTDPMRSPDCVAVISYNKAVVTTSLIFEVIDTELPHSPEPIFVSKGGDSSFSTNWGCAMAG